MEEIHEVTPFATVVTRLHPSERVVADEMMMGYDDMRYFLEVQGGCHISGHQEGGTARTKATDVWLPQSHGQ